MPYGGAPSCQRCHKAVYMAEQVIGPGGAYHVMCLTCKECNKRLDSTTLRERNNEAYCKVCYNRKWGPKGYGFASGAAFLSTEDKMPKDILAEQERQQEQAPPQAPPQIPVASRPSPQLPPRPENNNPSHTESTAPTATTTAPPPAASPALSSFWSSRPNPPPATPPKPAIPANKPVPPPVTATKPAYLATGYVPRKINLNIQNDTCTKCGKTVYAAEMALGAGNKYHRLCLKCNECGKLLSSSNMVDKDFDLYCRGCYAKLFGPKGFGYGNLLSTEGSTR